MGIIVYILFLVSSLFVVWQIGQKDFFILQIRYIVQALRASWYRNINKELKNKNHLLDTSHLFISALFLIDRNSGAQAEHPTTCNLVVQSVI